MDEWGWYREERHTRSFIGYSFGIPLLVWFCGLVLRPVWPKEGHGKGFPGPGPGPDPISGFPGARGGSGIFWILWGVRFIPVKPGGSTLVPTGQRGEKGAFWFQKGRGGPWVPGGKKGPLCPTGKKGLGSHGENLDLGQIWKKDLGSKGKGGPFFQGGKGGPRSNWPGGAFSGPGLPEINLVLGNFGPLFPFFSKRQIGFYFRRERLSSELNSFPFSLGGVRFSPFWAISALKGGSLYPGFETL